MRATRRPYSSNCAVGCEQTKTHASVYAAAHGMLEILGFLLDKGVSMGTQSGVYSTPLHQACERDDVDMVETILTKNGA
jgi:ankyrin repeat protein